MSARGGAGLVLGGTALIGTCYGFARFAYGLFAPEFQDTFGISRSLAGLIGAGSYVGYCVAIVASLVLTERLGARPVAICAGVVATVGIAVVALAPSAPVLAVGVLVAGSSTGLASPPLAAAVSRWVRAGARDRAQSIVNSGTGAGVLVSGPIAFLLIDDWRWAWAVYAVGAAAVTVWVAVVVPSPPASGPGERRLAGRTDDGTGMPVLVAASLVLGLSSVAVWTFGRDLVATAGHSGLVSTSMWTVLGAAGIVGALGGDLAGRVGLARSWSLAMVAMAAATSLLAVLAGSVVAVFGAAALFGGTYILLTALVLVWSTRVYPSRTSFGVGLSFLVIALGQAAGAALAGVLADATSTRSVFLACAMVGVLGAALRPARVVAGSAAR